MYILLFLIVVLSFVASICFYPYLPDEMGTHWSFSAEPDGFMPKQAGAFILPFIIAISTLVLAVVLHGVLPQCDNKWGRWCVSAYILMFGGFLFFAHLAVLLYNVGVNINVPLCVLSGLVVPTFGPVIFIIIALCKSRRTIAEPVPLQIASTSQTTYSDKLVNITADSITFYNYYFPTGNKTITFSDIEYIRVLKGGSLRLHGSDDFRTWWPADYNRMSRDRRFVVHLRNKWIRIGFTVENEPIVQAVLNNKGLIRENL